MQTPSIEVANLARQIAEVSGSPALVSAPRPAKRRRGTPEAVRLITINQLEKLLFSINGAKPVKIVSSTLVRMRKTANPYYNLVQKRQEHSVFLNFNYGAAVNRQRARENKAATFTPQPRKWGTRLAGSCLVYHEGQYYMEAKMESSSTPQFTLRGRPIDYSIIELYCPPRQEPKQGLDKSVIVRDFATMSVLEIVIDNIRYRVREESRRKRRRDQRANELSLLLAATAPQPVEQFLN